MGKIRINLKPSEKDEVDKKLERTPIKYRERETRGRGRVKETNLEKRGRKPPGEDKDRDLIDDTSKIDEIKKLMGFSGFGTTKNKKVEGTDCYGVKKIQRAEYRQYMNREKGFNRPLSPTREDIKGRKLHEKKKNKD
ncbi:hypothetical protein FOA43_003454 [Brettanomyces nanus]|uniref:U4/U6.U5 small nuclear ribonucleoprotein 27kDa protein domain-containing protein n=1 Tax=Eeniella nana TaxID=13502 RepID=A0A875S533_EENNA|nr:uncharacterized protein FOA43_003454 [Brettanomyces nanus]QPG76068.1 hypothetical protein FOA43_003454 [Brettanomyces nanus]